MLLQFKSATSNHYTYNYNNLEVDFQRGPDLYWETWVNGRKTNAPKRWSLRACVNHVEALLQQQLMNNMQQRPVAVQRRNNSNVP